MNWPWWFARDQYGPFHSEFGRLVVVINYERDCLVDQCNAGNLAAQGEIVMGNQDDMRYPEHWDTEISKLLPEPLLLVSCVQAKTDGARRDLLTIPSIATRPLVEMIGPLCPEYDGMFSDDEWSARARALGAVIQSDLYFEHRHPVHGTAKMDEVYTMENRAEAYQIGRSVFDKRRALGFPRVELPGFPPSPAPRPSPSPGLVQRAVSAIRGAFTDCETVPGMMPRPSRKLIACLPGEDNDRLANVLGLVRTAETNGFEFNANLGYTSSPDVTRMALTETVLKFWSGDASAPYVLWVDDDNLVSGDQLERLLSFLDATPEADIIVGWCWIPRGGQWMTSVGQFNESMHVSFLTIADMLSGGSDPKYFPRFASGFPCVLMRREVLERLGPRCFVKIQRDDFEYGGMGEDFSFFWRAHEAGMRCYLDPMCKVGHIKPQLQEPDLKLPPGGELPPIVEQWRRQKNGNRVEVPMSS